MSRESEIIEFISVREEALERIKQKGVPAHMEVGDWFSKLCVSIVMDHALKSKSGSETEKSGSEPLSLSEEGGGNGGHS